jgi:hypothetical protein
MTSGELRERARRRFGDDAAIGGNDEPFDGRVGSEFGEAKI